VRVIAEATAKERDCLTSLLILNIGRPISAKVSGGKVWTGILLAYRNDGLIIKKKYGKVLWNWPLKHLREIEVEIPLFKGNRLITMPD